MPNFSEPVSFTFIAISVVLIFVMVGIGIFAVKKFEEWTPEEIKPEPLIMGRDLIKLGYPPTPLFTKILNKISDLQLEEEIKTKEEAIDYVLQTWDKDE